MLKVLIFGGSGLIGSRIKQLLEIKYKIIAPSHKQVDVVNEKQTEQIIKRSQPDYIIYAAGLTSVDEAEKYPELANLLNIRVPGFIARLAASAGIPLLYFSTDAVFDGLKTDKPYTEDEKTNPLSVYGKSKLLGERQVLDASNKNCIVRVIMVYSHIFIQRKRFIQIILETLKKGEKVYGVIDQVVNPIYVDDVVWAIDRLLESKSYGIYHLGATDYVTNYEFVIKLAKVFHINENLVQKIDFEKFFEGRALRSKFCWLDTSKFRKKFGDNTLHFVDESIRLFKKNLDLLEIPQKYQ